MLLAKVTRAAIVAAALALSSTAAFAQEAPEAKPHFGDANQLALSINQDLPHSIVDFSLGTGVQLSYFIAPHVSLGLEGGIGWLSTSTTSAASGSSGVALRLGPRIGYDIPLSEVVSLWPQIGIDYRHYDESDTSTTVATFGASSSTTTSTTDQVSFVVVAPILLHPSKSFFIGAGPSFSTDLSNSTSASASGVSVSMDNQKVTALGLMATIGGAL